MIQSFETILVDVPTIRPHRMSVATMNTQTLVLVRVVCDDGIEGWGEATTIGGLNYGEESPESIKINIDTHIAPLLVGMDARHVAKAMAKIRKTIQGNRFAKCAIETALLDAQARRLKIPLSELLGGRLLLGLSTGDRAVEYPAFGADYENRGERYRDAFGLIKAVTEQDFPRAQTTHYGTLDGAIDLIPKPVGKRMPMIVVGRARQDIEWIAKHSDGWIWHLSDFKRLPELIEVWRSSHQGQDQSREHWIKPYGYGAMFDLSEDPHEPLRFMGNGIRTGRNALIDLFHEQQQLGVSHVALNLKPLRRPAGSTRPRCAASRWHTRCVLITSARTCCAGATW